MADGAGTRTPVGDEMRGDGVVAGLAGTAVGWLLSPGVALAATLPCPEPPPSIPEVPGGPALVIGVGIGVTAAAVYLYRRRHGAAAISITTLTAVAVMLMTLAITAAAATTDLCGGGGGVGGVSDVTSGGVGGGASATTPLTGALVPWLAGLLLVVLGGAAFRIGLPRRRARRR